VTTWVETPTGGRERGLRGVMQAWIGVILTPRQFFANAVSPGDQAPGLVFGIIVATAYVGGLFAGNPSQIPGLSDSSTISAGITVIAVMLLIAPATLHLTAALQTVLLILVVPSRAGVSETVQIVAYAAAPCIVAGIPISAIRVICTAYAAVLLIIGIREVHATSTVRAVIAAGIPATLLFGSALGGISAGIDVFQSLGIL
jgi:Uncharacterized protein conserved in archaea